MNLEIHNPELVQRVTAQIQRRHLHDADELIEKALDALDEKSPAPPTLPERRAPELPSWRLGVIGSLHRSEIYEDVR